MNKFKTKILTSAWAYNLITSRNEVRSMESMILEGIEKYGKKGYELKSCSFSQNGEITTAILQKQK